MSTNPYAAPRAQGQDLTGPEFESAGFWLRTGASLVDIILIVGITYPILYGVYGAEYFDAENNGFVAGPLDFMLTWVAPAIATLWFWRAKQATPGKLVFSLRVVDAGTGETMSMGQSIIRYIAYFASLIPMCVGFIWVAIDARNQGWHDKLAKTIVIRASNPR